MCVLRSLEHLLHKFGSMLAATFLIEIVCVLLLEYMFCYSVKCCSFFNIFVLCVEGEEMKMILSRPLYRSLYCASTRTPLAMKGSRFFSTQPTGQHGSAIRYTHGELSDMTLAEWAEVSRDKCPSVSLPDPSLSYCPSHTGF